MNYEQKYKEALERMKSWVRGEHPECFCEAQKAAEFIFPELKESEDERIQKSLIKAFGTIGKKYWGGLIVRDIIAWLEKQGKKPTDKIDTKFKVGDWRSDYKEALDKACEWLIEEYSKAAAYYEHPDSFIDRSKQATKVD